MANILVVERECEVRELLCNVFESGGHQVILSVSGDGGLFALRADKDIEIVTTNLNLPDQDMDGYEFIRRAKEEFPNIKSVLITGSPLQEEVSVNAFNVGFDRVLFKPFSNRVLLAVIVGLA